MAETMVMRDYILLAYKAFGGSIRGKTMFQKRMYFLSVMLHSDFGFVPHYYGPYSSVVAVGNLELKSLGLIHEFSASWGYDHRGFEMARYDYSLTDSGKDLADKTASNAPEVWKEMEGAANVIKQAGDLNYMELSIAAKAYFVLGRMQGKATLDQIHQLLPQFGWSVTKEELERATTFLEQAHLVTNEGSCHGAGASPRP